MSSMNTNNIGIKTNNTNNSNNNLFKIILIGIAIIFILYFIFSIIKGYKAYSKYSPYLIKNTVDGKKAQKIKAYQIPPPQDNQYGTEFSYSFWLYLKDDNFNNNSSEKDLGEFKHIFHKGSYDYNKDHLPLLQNPGVWVYPNTNKLHIRFNTYQNIAESCDVGNIPLNAWSHITIILIGNSVDVFINGNLKKRQKLKGVPKLNYEDLYISNWGGFNGYLSRLRYFNYAIQPFMIDFLNSELPSKELDSSFNDSIPTLSPEYWMTNGYPNSNFQSSSN